MGTWIILIILIACAASFGFWPTLIGFLVINLILMVILDN